MCYPVTLVTLTMAKRSPRITARAAFVMATRCWGTGVALRHQGTGLKQLRGIDFTSRAAPRSQKNEASDRLQPH